MKSQIRLALLMAALTLLVFDAACGGGGGSGSVAPPPLPTILLTTQSLSHAVQGRPYSATLTATGGVGALKWSIAPDPNSGPTGLSIDANTGVLSGTANFVGNGLFTATVTDANNNSSGRNLFVFADVPLSTVATSTVDTTAFFDMIAARLNVTGGVFPLHFRVAGGTVAPGLHIDAVSGEVHGAPYQPGTYAATIEISDSFTPPEVVTQNVTF